MSGFSTQKIAPVARRNAALWLAPNPLRAELRVMSTASPGGIAGGSSATFSVTITSSPARPSRARSARRFWTRSRCAWLTTETVIVAAIAPDASRDALAAPRRASAPFVEVLEADNVVLPEVGAGLHLDEVQRHLARVLEAVLLADRDVRRLVLGDEVHVRAARHSCCARHDNPMLGAVVVHLEAERRARLDHDPLDLEPVAPVDALVVAPRAVNAAVRDVLGPLRRVEVRDDVLDLLGVGAIRHQHRIGGFDHDRVS